MSVREVTGVAAGIVEHRCWCPHAYSEGLEGQRVAICGYSHYSREGDDPDLTNIVMRRVVSGESRYPFFTSIAWAFGWPDVSAFWERVLFFNFVPTSVGDADDKHAIASEVQHEAGRKRLRRLMDEHEPHKLFVFSTKAWNAFPDADTPKRVGENELLIGWRDYITSTGQRVSAVGIRHPQGAAAKLLREAVAFGLSR
jgi:hypothetical protein